MFKFRIIDWLAIKRFFTTFQAKEFTVNHYNTAGALVVHRDRNRLVQAYLVGFISFAEASRLLLFFFFPIQDVFWQIFLYDYYIPFQVPTIFKFTNSIIYVVINYMLYVLYFHIYDNKIAKELYGVMVEPHTSVISSWLPTFTRVTSIVLNSTHFFTLLVISWLILSLTTFVIAMMPYFQSLTWESLLSLPLFLVNFFFSSIAMTLVIYSCKVALAFSLLSSLIMFAHLEAVNRMLRRDWTQRSTILHLRRFLVRHKEVVAIVFDLNRIYGHLLLVFMIFNLPINITIVGMALLSMVTPLIRFLFIIFSFAYLISFVGIHWMAALYTRKIHSPFRLVVSLFIRLRKCTLRVRWKVANKIEVFLTRKPYGITYGSFGLVSMTTFARFLFLYGKFIIITYKNFKKIEYEIS